MNSVIGQVLNPGRAGYNIPCQVQSTWSAAWISGLPLLCRAFIHSTRTLLPFSITLEGKDKDRGRTGEDKRDSVPASRPTCGQTGAVSFTAVRVAMSGQALSGVFYGLLVIDSGRVT